MGISAFGATITEDFSSATNFDSENSTAVWNLSTEKLHLPPFVTAPVFNDATTPVTLGAISLGTGEDGVFDASTYADFDTDGGSPNLITLDTSKTYQFISVHIEDGFTITASGNAPLTWLVQGAVQIDGIIDIGGEDGEGISSDVTATPNGGGACCGGTAGGAGGSTLQVALAGTSANPANNGGGSAGSASGSAGNGSGGGGGAGYGDQGSAAGSTPAGGGAGGAVGSTYDDFHVSLRVGGSGGGGGALYSLGAANENGTGGGGGGGGGVFVLHAGGDITITDNGRVRSQGGNGGGENNAVRLSGSGGGGSGGSIVMFSSTLFDNNCDNGVGTVTIDAEGGSEGTGTSGGDGGSGANGRIRIVTSQDITQPANAGGWCIGDSESPTILPANVTNVGFVRYATGTDYIVTSKVLDTGNSNPNYNSVTTDSTTTANTTVVTEVAGSRDNFTSDDTGFTTNINSLDGKRYLKFRVTLHSSSQTETPLVNSITVDFDEQVQSAFNFKVKGCARTAMNEEGFPLGYLVLIVFLLGLPYFVRTWLPISRPLEANDSN